MPNYWDDLWGESPEQAEAPLSSNSASNYWDDLWEEPEPSPYRGLPTNEWNPNELQSEGNSSLTDNFVTRWFDRAAAVGTQGNASFASAGLDLFDSITSSNEWNSLVSPVGPESMQDAGFMGTDIFKDPKAPTEYEKWEVESKLADSKKNSLSGAASDIFGDLAEGSGEVAQALGAKYDTGSILGDMKQNFPSFNPFTWDPQEALQDTGKFGSDMTADLAGMAISGGPLAKILKGVGAASKGASAVGAAVKGSGDAIGSGMALSVYGDTYAELTKNEEDSRMVAVLASGANAVVQGVVEKIGWDVAVGKTVFGQWFKDSVKASAMRALSARLLLATPTETAEESIQKVTDIVAKRLPGLSTKGWDAVQAEIQQDVVEQVPEAAFSGALGGPVLGGGSFTIERGSQWVMTKFGAKDVAARNAGTDNTPEQQLANSIDTPISEEKAKDALLTVIDSAAGGDLTGVFDKDRDGVMDGPVGAVDQILDAAKNANAAQDAADEAIKDVVKAQEIERAEIGKDLTSTDIDAAGTRIQISIEKAGQERGAKAGEVAAMAQNLLQWAQGGAATFDAGDTEATQQQGVQMQVTPEEMTAQILYKAAEVGVEVPQEALTNPAGFDWQGWTQTEVEKGKESARNGLSEPLQAIREAIEPEPDSPMAQVLSSVPAPSSAVVQVPVEDDGLSQSGRDLAKFREVDRSYSGWAPYMPDVSNALHAAKGNDLENLRPPANAESRKPLSEKNVRNATLLSDPQRVVAEIKKRMPDVKDLESREDIAPLIATYAKLMGTLSRTATNSDFDVKMRELTLPQIRGTVVAIERALATQRIPGITTLPALVTQAPDIESSNRLTKNFTYEHDLEQDKGKKKRNWTVGMPSMSTWLKGDLIPGAIAGGASKNPQQLREVADIVAAQEQAAFQVAPQIKSMIYAVWQTGSKALVERLGNAIRTGQDSNMKELAVAVSNHVASQGYFIDLPALLASDPAAMEKFALAIPGVGKGIMSPWALERVMVAAGTTELEAKSAVAFLTAMSERWAMRTGKDVYEFWDKLGDYTKVLQFLKSDVSGLAQMNQDSDARALWGVKYAREFGKGMLQMFTGKDGKGKVSTALHETIHMLYGNNLMYEMLDQEGRDAMESLAGEKLWDKNGNSLPNLSAIAHERMAVGFEVFVMENRAPNKAMKDAWQSIKSALATYIKGMMRSLGVSDPGMAYLYGDAEWEKKGGVTLRLKDLALDAAKVRAFYQLVNANPDGSEIVYNSPGVATAMEALLTEATGIPAKGVFTQASRTFSVDPKMAEKIEDDWDIHSGHGPSDSQWRRMVGLSNSESDGTHTHATLLAMQKEREYLDGLAKDVKEAPSMSARTAPASRAAKAPADLSDEGIEKFYSKEVAEAQRGKPESAMLKAQRAMGTGVLSFALEHIGDLTHRMSEYPARLNGGYEYVLEKVDKTLSLLTSKYGFARDAKEGIEANKQYAATRYGTDVSGRDAEVAEALSEYSKAHSKIPTYNEVQFLAREAAVALGEGRYDEVTENLKTLKRYLNEGPKAWRARTLEYNAPSSSRMAPASKRVDAQKELLKAVSSGEVLKGEALYDAQIDQLVKQVMSGGKDAYGSGDVVDPTNTEKVKDMLSNFMSKMRSWKYLISQGKVDKAVADMVKSGKYGLVATLVGAAKKYENSFGSSSAQLERMLEELSSISDEEKRRLMAEGGQDAVDRRIVEVNSLNMGSLAKALNNHYSLSKLADKVAEKIPQLWDGKLNKYVNIAGARSFNQITTTFNQMADSYYEANKDKLPYVDKYEFHEAVTRDLRAWMYSVRQFELIENVKMDIAKWEEAKRQWNLDVANALLEGKKHEAPEPPKPKVPRITEEGTQWAESAKMLLELRYGKNLAMFKATAQELVQWENHMVLDKLLSVNMISAKEHTDMIRKGKHHIPMYRVRDAIAKSGAVNPRLDDSVYKVLDYLKNDISHKSEDPINSMLRRAAGIEMLTMRQHAKNTIGQRILTDVKWWASDYADSPFQILSFKEEINKEEFEELQKSGEFVVTSTTKYKKDDQNNKRESGKHYYKHIPYKAEHVEEGLKRITSKAVLRGLNKEAAKEADAERSKFEQTIFAFYPEPGKPMYVVISDPSLAEAFFHLNNSQAAWQDSLGGFILSGIDSMAGADPHAEASKRYAYKITRGLATGLYGFNKFAKSAITSNLSFLYNAIFRDMTAVIRSRAGLRWRDIPTAVGDASALLFPSLMEIYPEKFQAARDASQGMATFSGLAATNLKGDLDAEVLFSLTRGRGDLMSRAKAGSYEAVSKLMWNDMKQFFAKEGLTTAPGQMWSELKRGKNRGKHFWTLAKSPINMGIAGGQFLGTIMENTTRLAERRLMMSEDMGQYPTLSHHYDPTLAINGKLLAGFTGTLHRKRWERAKRMLAKDPNYKVPEDSLPVQTNMTERDHAMNHITLNFAQRGRHTATMDQHIMFFNPMAQDFYTNIMILARHSALQKAVAKALGNDWKAAKDQVRLDAAAHAWLIKSFFYITIPAMGMLAMYGGDDDESKEWQAQSMVEKLSYNWLPTDRIGLTENPIRVAQGLGLYSLFFKDMPMAFYLDATEKDPKAWGKYWQRFFDGTPFGMIGSPMMTAKEDGLIAGGLELLSRSPTPFALEAVDPVVELVSDREKFRDKNIAFPQALAREDPSEVQRERHNMFVNAVTKAFSWSKLQPAQVKYLIDRYTPGSSKWIPGVVNKGMETAAGVEGIPTDVQPSNSPIAGQSPGWWPRWQAKEAWGMGNQFVQDLLSTARDASEQMRSYEQMPESRKPVYLADHPLIKDDIYYGKRPDGGFRSGGLSEAAKKVIAWDKDKKNKLKAGLINETEAMLIERQYTLFAMEEMRNVVFQLGE